MNKNDNQIEYWDSVAWEKTFSVPLEAKGLKSTLSQDQQILDYGCGYGRISAELQQLGFNNVIGVDSSPEMIGRARKEHPDMEFHIIDGWNLPYEEGSFDAVLLYAVLTCVPSDENQRRLVSEIRRVLRPDGILHIGDFLIQDNDRNRQRYNEYLKKHGTYGVFELPEGVVLRHHTPEWIRSLTSDFECISFKTDEATTMNGNPATIFYYFGRKLSTP